MKKTALVVLSIVALAVTGCKDKPKTEAPVTAAPAVPTAAPTAVLYGVGNGLVVYGAQNKTYTWSAASPQSSSLLIDTAPGQTLISGSTLYFTQGASQAVYKVTLQ